MPRTIAYNPADAPADIATSFGMPDELCREIAAEHRKAALWDLLPVMISAIPDLATLGRMVENLAADAT